MDPQQHRLDCLRLAAQLHPHTSPFEQVAAAKVFFDFIDLGVSQGTLAPPAAGGSAQSG